MRRSSPGRRCRGPVLALPVWILQYLIGCAVQVVAVVAWLLIVVTGKLPRRLFDVLEFGNSYTARTYAYLLLLTETYPPFQEEQTPFADIDGRSVPGAGWGV